MANLAFRKVTAKDVDEMAAIVADAFVDYRAFAPTGWLPPPASEQVGILQRWIANECFWGEVASDDSSIAGHASFIPATRHSSHAVADPRLAHLGHLFVRPRYWGAGVARSLLTRATAAAADRGFVSMRLFVMEGQTRARHFYAREGFAAAGEPFDPGLGLSALEYRRRLDA
jgi:GNAT superfamily N-acetyltransferase